MVYWWHIPAAEPIPWEKFRQTVLQSTGVRLKLEGSTRVDQAIDAVFQIFGLTRDEAASADLIAKRGSGSARTLSRVKMAKTFDASASAATDSPAPLAHGPRAGARRARFDANESRFRARPVSLKRDLTLAVVGQSMSNPTATGCPTRR